MLAKARSMCHHSLAITRYLSAQAPHSYSTAHYLAYKQKDKYELVQEGVLRKRTRRKRNLLRWRIFHELYALLDVAFKPFGTSLEQFLLIVIDMW